MLAAPTTEGFATLAPAIDCVGETNLQYGVLWLFWSFFDAQRKRVEIEDGISAMHQAAGRNMTVTKDHMTAGVACGVIPNDVEETEPVSIAVIVSIHNFDLVKVNPFTANIDIGGRLIIKPELRFHSA